MLYTAGVGLWYWLGVVLGLGVALGTAFAGLLAPLRAGLALASVGAAACGYGLALALVGLVSALSGAAGGIVGGFAAAQLCRRTIARGGGHGATATLLVLAAAAVAGLSFVPALGYLEVVLAALLILRLSRRGKERYAGLRTLARD